jgi:hypothetical protein
MNNNAIVRRNEGQLSRSLEDEWKSMNAALAKVGPIQNAKPRPFRRTGRLIIALDLTSSRETSLRQARIATAAMFEVLQSIGAGGLAVKLVYYRGQECKASGWERDAGVLRRAMEKLSCKAGYTQIGRVLNLALDEKEPVSGVVFVGDSCEEDADELVDLAADLGDKNTPVFVFHDFNGRDIEAARAAAPIFEDIAEASSGAYCPFGVTSAGALREVLASVAVFSAAGAEGVKQIEQATTPEARHLQARLMLGPGKGQ